VVVQLRLSCPHQECGSAPPPLNEPEGDMSGLTLSATYRWVITDWSKKRGQDELISETFSVGGRHW